MTRPKASLVGFGNLATSVYNTHSIKKLGSEFDSMTQQIESGNSLTLTGIKSIQELQIASLAGQLVISNQLDELTNAQWDILKQLEIEDKREEVLGSLKLFLINVEEEVGKIRNLFERYPEYAALMAEDLNNMMEQSEVDIEKFKRMPSTEDIKWAKTVLGSVNVLKESLFSKL